MTHYFRQLLEMNPVIAAVKSREELSEAVTSQVEGIFLLGGNICELQEMIEIAKGKEKKLYVHIDLIEGIGKDHFAIKYLKDQFNPDGILTTKPNLVKYAKELDLFVIQRIFMLDSRAFEVAEKLVRTMEPHAVEILPGIIPKVIQQIEEKSRVPIIAGGLVRTKHEAIECLKAGAMGVSTSCKAIWNM